MTPRGELLHDADCGFCTRCAAWAARHGARTRPLQSVDLPALGVDADRAVREVPYRHADGRVTWGAAAIADALRDCAPPWWLLGRVLATAPVQAVARPLYAQVAAHRHRLPGGTAACALPPTTATHVARADGPGGR